MQWRAALWITGAFQISPILGVEAIARLVPIYLYLKKLYGRFLLQQSSLPSNHIIHSILSLDRTQEHKSHNAFIDHLIAKQRSWLKSSIIDVDDKCNQCFSSFSFFNKEFKPGNHIADTFPDHFSFYPCSSDIKKHFKNLEEIILKASSDLFSTIAVSDVSIKNQITISILHIHFFNKPVIKTLHRTINITIAEAELFAIWCGINQVITNYNVKNIIVITSSLHIARRIFNSSTHPYQIHSVAISIELREFFPKILRTVLNFGIALVNSIGHFISWLTKEPKTWCLSHYSCANSLRTSAKNPSTSLSHLSGR